MAAPINSAPAGQKSKTLYWVLGILAGLLLIGGIAAFIWRNKMTDSDNGGINGEEPPPPPPVSEPPAAEPADEPTPWRVRAASITEGRTGQRYRYLGADKSLAPAGADSGYAAALRRSNTV